MLATDQETRKLSLERFIHVLQELLYVPILIEVEGIVSLQLPIVIENVISFERGIQLDIKNAKTMTIWKEEIKKITFDFDHETIVFIEGNSMNFSFLRT